MSFLQIHAMQHDILIAYRVPYTIDRFLEYEITTANILELSVGLRVFRLKPGEC